MLHIHNEKVYLRELEDKTAVGHMCTEQWISEFAKRRNRKYLLKSKKHVSNLVHLSKHKNLIIEKRYKIEYNEFCEGVQGW